MRIKFKYKNHRGEIEERDVDVSVLRFDFTNHPEFGYQPGWAITGFDYSRGRDGKEVRTFYLSNVIIEPNYQQVFDLMRLFSADLGDE